MIELLNYAELLVPEASGASELTIQRCIRTAIRTFAAEGQCFRQNFKLFVPAGYDRTYIAAELLVLDRLVEARVPDVFEGAVGFNLAIGRPSHRSSVLGTPRFAWLDTDGQFCIWPTAKDDTEIEAVINITIDPFGEVFPRQFLNKYWNAIRNLTLANVYADSGREYTDLNKAAIHAAEYQRCLEDARSSFEESDRVHRTVKFSW